MMNCLRRLDGLPQASDSWPILCMQLWSSMQFISILILLSPAKLKI